MRLALLLLYHSEPTAPVAALAKTAPSTHETPTCSRGLLP